MQLNIIHIQGITTPTHLYYAKYTDTSLKLKLFISYFPVKWEQSLHNEQRFDAENNQSINQSFSQSVNQLHV